jgi:hypothetical protein
MAAHGGFVWIRSSSLLMSEAVAAVSTKMAEMYVVAKVVVTVVVERPFSELVAEGKKYYEKRIKLCEEYQRSSDRDRIIGVSGWRYPSTGVWTGMRCLDGSGPEREAVELEPQGHTDRGRACRCVCT